MAAFTGSGPDRVPNDIMITDFKKDAGKIGSQRLSEEAIPASIPPDAQALYLKRYARGYELLRRAGSDQTIHISTGVQISRVGFANQVIDQQRTLEHYGLRNTAARVRSAIDRKVTASQ